MSYYVQQEGRNSNWISVDAAFDTLGEAKTCAEKLPVREGPCVLRIVDDQSVVHGWVARNGYKPGAKKQ
jgi:hypothetical protein